MAGLSQSLVGLGIASRSLDDAAQNSGSLIVAVLESGKDPFFGLFLLNPIHAIRHIDSDLS